MGFRRLLVSRTRTTTLLITAGVLAIISVPGLGGARTYSPGVVPAGVLEPGDKGDDRCTLSFSFAGRMPAGASAYQVTSGEANGIGDSCGTLALTLKGEAPSGSFEWNCLGALNGVLGEAVLDVPSVVIDPAPVRVIGPTWVLDATCKTVGRRGQFRLRVVLISPEGDKYPSNSYESYEVVGAYLAVTP